MSTNESEAGHSNKPYGIKKKGAQVAHDENDDSDSPCRKLLAAVLERALFDLHHKHSWVRQNARRWFLSENFTPFSFRWVCGELFEEELIFVVIVEMVKSGKTLTEKQLNILRHKRW